MPIGEPVASDGARSPEAGGRRVLAKVVEGFAVGLQTVVLLGTYVMGLGWGGGTHTAAAAQAVVAFLPLLWLAPRRRPGWMLLVPAVSAALSGALLMAGQALGHTGP